jgi:hypothetical protein
VAELEQVPPTSDCCSSEAQVTCCEPADKAECCGKSAAAGTCGCSAGVAPTDEIREEVRARYAAAATSVSEGGTCCDDLPDTATMASLDCGNPTAIADLREGEAALDLAQAVASTSCSPPAGSARPVRPTAST